MYPAALHKIFTQTVDSSWVFERWVLQKQPKINNKITKSWNANIIKDLEQVRPKQAPDFPSRLFLSKLISPRLILSYWSIICLVRSICQKWFLKKFELFESSCYKWSPVFIRNFQKTVFFFLQTHVENTLWVRNTVLLVTMTRCASYLTAVSHYTNKRH